MPTDGGNQGGHIVVASHLALAAAAAVAFALAVTGVASALAATAVAGTVAGDELTVAGKATASADALLAKADTEPLPAKRARPLAMAPDARRTEADTMFFTEETPSDDVRVALQLPEPHAEKCPLTAVPLTRTSSVLASAPEGIASVTCICPTVAPGLAVTAIRFGPVTAGSSALHTGARPESSVWVGFAAALADATLPVAAVLPPPHPVRASSPA